MMNILDNVLYTAEATTTGGRDGRSRSSDGMLDIRLAMPREMGGKGDGTNPEQLFAAGYSACFMSSLKVVAAREKIVIPADTTIVGRVGIGPIATGYCVQVELRVHIPGVSHDAGRDLVQKAHVICPYSNATRGNIKVDIMVV